MPKIITKKSKKEKCDWNECKKTKCRKKKRQKWERNCNRMK